MPLKNTFFIFDATLAGAGDIKIDGKNNALQALCIFLRE